MLDRVKDPAKLEKLLGVTKDVSKLSDDALKGLLKMSDDELLALQGKNIVEIEAAVLKYGDEVVDIASSTIKNVKIKYAKASFGNSTTSDYRKVFFDAFPDKKGKIVVHHAVEQKAVTEFPHLVTKGEIHSLENLRGIPKDINPDLHLSKIRKEWNKFYNSYSNPTKQQLLDKATEIDDKFGHLFDPPIR